MLKMTKRSNAVNDKANDLASAATDTTGTVKEKLAPAVEQAKDVKTAAVKQRKQIADLLQQTTKQNKKQAKRQTQQAKKSGKRAANNFSVVDCSAPAALVGVTVEQVQAIFRDEWMPRIQQAIQSAGVAGQQAYAALHAQTRETVENGAPAVKQKKKKKGGGLLIVLGLLTGAGAATLIISNKKKVAATRELVPLPSVETVDLTTDVCPTNSSTNVSRDPRSTDLTGDVEKQVATKLLGTDSDIVASDTPRGKHAARD